VTSIKDLKHDHKNARKRTDRSAALIAESLKRFGAARSIVIDEDGRILAGNGTVEGARKAGIDKLRIIEAEGDELIAVRRTGLSEDDKVGLALADNRSSDLSEWDNEMLRQLSEEHDLTPWFEDDELLAEVLDTVEGNTDPDDVPEPPTEPITKPGDLWILGNHRLLCGDSTDVLAVERLMDGQKADMVFTDPPYGVSVVKDGKVGADFGVAKKGRYAEVIGDDTTQTAHDAIAICQSLKVPVQIYWGGNYYADRLPPTSCWLIWDKRGDSGIVNTFADCELAWTNMTGPARIHKQLWNGMIREGEKDKRVHPTQKPVALAEWAVEQYLKGSTVLDLFLGSGSTLIACEKLRKACYGMEMSPAYCDVIVKRWEDFTGNTAVCVPSDQHFTEQQEAF
jgi:16S rRNA G966 N2-methylase RsmD